MSVTRHSFVRSVTDIVEKCRSFKIWLTKVVKYSRASFRGTVLNTIRKEKKIVNRVKSELTYGSILLCLIHSSSLISRIYMGSRFLVSLFHSLLSNASCPLRFSSLPFPAMLPTLMDPILHFIVWIFFSRAAALLFSTGVRRSYCAQLTRCALHYSLFCSGCFPWFWLWVLLRPQTFPIYPGLGLVPNLAGLLPLWFVGFI